MKNIVLTSLLLLLSLSTTAQTKLSLQQCIDSARLYNHTLHNAALEIQSAQYQQQEAYTKYYPEISANMLAFQAFDKIIKGDGVIPAEVAALSPALAAYAGKKYSIREFDRAYSISVQAFETIYAGGRIHSANKLAGIRTDAKKLLYTLQEKDITQKITENYWKIASIKYNLSTLDAADKQVAAIMKQVEQYVKSGVTTRNDLLKVKLRQQELASTRLELENGQHILLLLLAQQIGMAHTPIDIEDKQDTNALPTPLSVYISPSQALGNREELALANKTLEADKEEVRMERGKNLPSFSIGLVGYNTGIGGFSSKVNDLLKTNMTYGLAVATVSIPISSWWGGSKAIHRRKIAVDIAQNNLTETQELLNVDIESAWADLNVAYKQIDIARASVDEAAENLRISSLQYNAGTETITNLLDAETLNRKANNSLSEALANYQSRLSKYYLKTQPLK